MKFKSILFTLFTILFLTPSVYAATAKEFDNVEEVGNIYATLPTSGEYPIYITHIGTDNATINIKDTTNFKVIDITDSDGGNYDGNPEKVVVLKNPLSKTTFTNPYSITFDNAGYYVNSKGKPVYVDIVFSVTESSVTYNDSYTHNSNDYYYEMATVGPNYLWVESLEIKKSTGKRIDESKSTHPGRHDKITLQILDNEGKALSSSIASKISLQWLITDLDVRDYTQTEPSYSGPYRESIKFNGGFENKFYVRTASVLDISENGTKYSATETTGNDTGSGQKSYDYSGVVAYQNKATANVEWWGSNCGTELVAINYGYPNLSAPTKRVDEKYTERYKQVDDVFSYTIKQFFPATVAGVNAPKEITLSDSFDKALDITDMTIKVYDDDDNDVTSSWENITPDGTRVVTLKYRNNNNSIVNVTGTYKFKFSNIKVLEPDSTHETKTENNGITYKIIPNQATVKVKPSSGDDITKTTNVVNIYVTNGAIKLTKEVVGESILKNPKTGDIVKYKFTIKNTGKSKLTNVTLEDRLSGFKITSQVKTTLEAGEEITATGEYALKEADIVGGKIINNVAVVTAKDPNNNTVTDTDDVDVTIETDGKIKLTKEVVGSSTFKNPKAGTTVKYKFTIKNTGETKLTEVTLTDKLADFVIDGEVKTTLEVGEEITVNGHYDLKKDDIVNGKTIKNVAIVTAKDPDGNPVTDTDDVDIKIIEEIINPQTGSKAKAIFILESLLAIFVATAMIIKKKVDKNKLGDE